MRTKKYHVVLKHRRRELRALRMGFGNGELFLIPDLPIGRARCGIGHFQPGEKQANPLLKDAKEGSDGFHLSIHRDGRVHIKDRSGYVLDPLHAEPLANLRGQHVASISIPLVAALPELGRPIKQKSGKEEDFIFKMPDRTESAEISIHISSMPGVFRREHGFSHFSIPAGAASLYIGLRMVGRTAPLGPNPCGVMIIAGWKPVLSVQEEVVCPQKFFYVIADDRPPTLPG